MKKLILTEDERMDILSKYTEADDRILIYLRRNFPVYEVPKEFQDIVGKYRMLVDDKSILVRNNFNNLVNRIDNLVSDEFPDVDDKKRRQTIKKYVKYFEE